MNNKTMGDKIAEMRKSIKSPKNPNKPLSQEELSEYMGIQQRTISNWENDQVGKGDKSEIKTLLKFCDFLGCSPDYLLGYSETPLHIQGDISEATGLSMDAIDFLRGFNEYCRSLEEEGRKTDNQFALDRAVDYRLIIDFISYLITNMDFDIMVRHIKSVARINVIEDLAVKFNKKADDEKLEAAIKNKSDEDKLFIAELYEEIRDMTHNAVSSKDAADATAFRFSQMATEVLDSFSDEHLQTALDVVEREVGK